MRSRRKNYSFAERPAQRSSVFTGYFPDRIYGFIAIGRRDLGELLVENGLGRIHGQRVWGLTEQVRKKLAELEAEAKAEGRGAWALASDQ